MAKHVTAMHVIYCACAHADLPMQVRHYMQRMLQNQPTYERMEAAALDFAMLLAQQVRVCLLLQIPVAEGGAG